MVLDPVSLWTGWALSGLSVGQIWSMSLSWRTVLALLGPDPAMEHRTVGAQCSCVGRSHGSKIQPHRNGLPRAQSSLAHSCIRPWLSYSWVVELGPSLHSCIRPWLKGVAHMQGAALTLREQLALLCSICPSVLPPAFFPVMELNAPVPPWF